MSGVPPIRSQNILLLDGDLRSTERLARLLREDGFDVEVESDGRRAMTRLSRQPLPDTLLTELSVPTMDGATVARFAVQRRPDIRVIVLTRYPNLLGPTAFGSVSPVVLSKPLDYPRLLELLGETSSFTGSVARPLLPGTGEC